MFYDVQLTIFVLRMPADPKQLFGIPSTYDYMTVCAYSSHDSSTLRAWWEEDRNVSQRYYNEVLDFFSLVNLPRSC